MDRAKGITGLLDSLDFFGLFGVTELLFSPIYFERRYQKSSLSLELGLVVWNRRFQRERNPSLFKLPLCGVFKDWNRYRFPITLLFWQSNRTERVHYWTLGCGSLTPANWFLSHKTQLTLKVAASSNVTVRRYLWITAPGWDHNLCKSALIRFASQGVNVLTAPLVGWRARFPISEETSFFFGAEW